MLKPVEILGAALAVMLALYPRYYAVHPTNAELTLPLGFAFLLTPPPPPYGLVSLRVEHTNKGFLLAGGVAAGVFASRFRNRRLAQPQAPAAGKAPAAVT